MKLKNTKRFMPVVLVTAFHIGYPQPVSIINMQSMKVIYIADTVMSTDNISSRNPRLPFHILAVLSVSIFGKCSAKNFNRFLILLMIISIVVDAKHFKKLLNVFALKSKE